jgi:starch phosphorylase
MDVILDPRKATVAPSKPEHTRTGTSVDVLKRAFLDNRFCLLGRPADVATPRDNYVALAYTVRDRLMERFTRTQRSYKEARARTVCYFSAEFLVGPHTENNLLNLGIRENVELALKELGLDLDELLEQEEEPGLGNGGLGRLAACYMDSLATLGIPSIGYGIRYEYGIFDQEIRDGWQVEITDAWLRDGNPWELPRPKLRFPVKFGGHTEHYTDDQGRLRVNWVPELTVYGKAFDTPILGFGVPNVSLLRLWKSEPRESFNFQAFNIGDYYGAVSDMVIAENLSKVLYPNDEPEAGKELRLKQQYFFVSCSLQDMLRLHLRESATIEGFDRKFVAQLNDTHPAIAVAELMRLLVDEYLLPWDDAWAVTRNTFAYTNHTLLPEALETWPEALFRRVLPRHLEIIFEINQHFLDAVRARFPGDEARVRGLSLIYDAAGRRVRMANLACVGSFSINGVAKLHTELLKSTVLRDFAEMWPEKFNNKTNGVTPRRFVALSNPGLSRLLTDALASGWERNPERLHALESLATDSAFHDKWRAAKQEAKTRFANWLGLRCGFTVDPATLFDVQVKRIHEYKRQHLNVLHILGLYARIKASPSYAPPPRTFVFGGKAAPGYWMAKLIIKLINAVGEVVNGDPQVNRYLRVVFVPDFNVKTGQRIYPAADLSEQISTAGKEASGTGNMKFSMNGALTIGTLDGANVEICEAVGEDNFFLFGLAVDEVTATWAAGYRPREVLDGNPQLQAIFDVLGSGVLSHGDRALFRPLVDNLLDHDPYLVLKDFQAYVDCQETVGHCWIDTRQWTRKSILNVARVGRFSSDRAIQEYCDDIWKVEPLVVGPGQ